MLDGTELLLLACPWSVSFLHVGFDLIIDLWQGGGIAAGFATKYPEMVDENIILLAPTGLLKVGNEFLWRLIY